MAFLPIFILIALAACPALANTRSAWRRLALLYPIGVPILGIAALAAFGRASGGGAYDGLGAIFFAWVSVGVFLLALPIGFIRTKHEAGEQAAE